jgi:hypothetical protein
MPLFIQGTTNLKGGAQLLLLDLPFAPRNDVCGALVMTRDVTELLRPTTFVNKPTNLCFRFAPV